MKEKFCCKPNNTGNERKKNRLDGHWLNGKLHGKTFIESRQYLKNLPIWKPAKEI